MSAFPGSPRLIRGGIVILDPQTSAVRRVITLQYNPDSITRTLQVHGVGADSGDRLEALRLKGPATETIKLEASMDATDQLAVGDGQTVALGLHPQLAALESMANPTSAQLLQANLTAQSGSLEIAAAEGPLTLFVWSKHRIVPFRLIEFSVTEEAFDVNLNPIRARVNLGLRVLTVDDIGFESKAANLFMSYLRQKEDLAQRSPSAALGSLGIGGVA